MAEVYFSGTDSNGQYELWQTDGTAAGTTEVTRGLGLANQTGGLAPSNIFVDGAEVLFNGDDAAGSHTLWTYFPSSGTVSELTVPDPSSMSTANNLTSPAQFTSFDNLIYFSGYSISAQTFDLWSTNGTAIGTQDAGPVAGQNPATGVEPGNIVVLQNQLLFTGLEAGNQGYGTSIEYTSNGTAAGTVPSSLNPEASSPIVLGSNLIYAGFDDPHNEEELYSSINGELTPNQGGSQVNSTKGINPTNFTKIGSAVLFNGNDASNHHELYVTDGTVAGTTELSGIIGESTTGLNPSAGAVIGNRMLFAGYDTTTLNGVKYRGLWSTDGTVAGTYEIAVTGADQYGVQPGGLTAISATQAIFNGQDAAGYYGLWITDGTTAGTHEITGIAGAAAGGINPGNFAASPIVACFLAGTRIRTRHGDVLVEDLREGDIAITAFGDTPAEAPIRWIGHTRIDLDRHPAPAGAAPIRVVAGAFAENRPDRDLLLSPDHSVFLSSDQGPALVPIRLLLNGHSIRRDAATGTVTYYHVELDQHDVLLANNLAAESYLDTGNRADFANGGTVRTLFPEFHDCPWRHLACAGMVTEGIWLDRLRRDLAARAPDLGFVPDADPALRIEADGCPVEPLRIAPHRWRAILPAHATRLRLLSRSFVPDERDPAANDPRRLGIALRALRLDGRAITVATGRASGLHPPEAGWCWTDGAARLPLPPAHHPVVLEIETLDLGVRYLTRPAEPDRRRRVA